MWFIIMIRQVTHGFCWGQADRSIYITVTCTSCGAKNQVIKGRLSNCEYCGQSLNS